MKFKLFLSHMKIDTNNSYKRNGNLKYAETDKNPKIWQYIQT